TLTSQGTDTAIRALEAGAVECIGKPSGLSADLVNVGENLLEAVTRASVSRVQARRPAIVPVRVPPPSVPTGIPAGGRLTAHNLLVIASSTGGPPALTQVVPHLPGGFTGALAKRLDALSPLSVAEAVHGEPVLNGRVYIAPGDYHLVVGKDKRIQLNQEPSLHGVRPSVDLTLFSVAEVFGRAASVAILTGMGRHGAEGAARLEAAGGKVITHDEATC
ncbi:MAG TPA: chemotaxis protein CheB, partial [Verrucomicrobiota bacterium]|nr:chemotaxis protein CheB [Verrucomicrobiota bacterium]